MNKIIKSNWFISFGVSILFLLLSLFLFRPFYDQADDYYMALGLSNGDKIAFINYFLGVFVSFLQGMFVKVNMFSITQISIAFFLMCIINQIFLSRYSKVYAIPIILIFDTIIAANHFCKVGFTQLSSLCMCIGVIAIIHGIVYKKRNFKIIGITTIILGSFFRFNNVFIGFLFLLIGLFVYFIIYKIYIKKSLSFKKLFAKDFLVNVFSPVIILIILVFGFQYTSTQIYNMDTSFKHYIEQNHIRSNVEDYPILSYENNEEIYSNLELSENDYEMIINWQIDGGYENDTLIKLANESKVLRPNLIQSVSGILRYIYYQVANLSDIGIFILFFIFVISIYIIFFKFKYFLFPISISIGIGILYLYLFYIQRYPYRVVYGIWMLAICILIYLLKNCELNKLGYRIICLVKNNKLRFLSVLLSIFVCVFYSFTYYNNFKQFFITNDNSNLFKFINSSDYNFAVIGENYNIRNSSYTYKNPLSLDKDIYLNKCVSWGMVYYGTPFYTEQLNDKNISNLYYDLIDNDEIMLIDNVNSRRIGLLVTYLNEHGEKDVKYSIVDEIDQFGVYKLESY